MRWVALASLLLMGALIVDSKESIEAVDAAEAKCKEASGVLARVRRGYQCVVPVTNYQ